MQTPDNADQFTEAQRHSIGVCVSQLGEHLRTLRNLGIESASLTPLEHALDLLADETGAKKPQPPRNAVNATLVQMLVLEEELRPSRMTAYGDVSDAAARILDAHVQRLVELTDTLISRTQQTQE